MKTKIYKTQLKGILFFLVLSLFGLTDGVGQNPIVLVPFSGSNTVSNCTDVTLQDHAGTANYANNANGFTVLESSNNSVINISGSYATENCCDRVRIYNGVGTSGTILATYNGSGTANYTGNPGQTLTVGFTSDGSVVSTGFNFEITYTGCDPNFIPPPPPPAPPAPPTAEAPSAGDGSVGDPYQIATLNNLIWLRDNTNSGSNISIGNHFIQTADIDMIALNNWTPIGSGNLANTTASGQPQSFRGTYDGQNYVISNLKINSNASQRGLFGHAWDATIRNVRIENADVVCGEASGILIGQSSTWVSSATNAPPVNIEKISVQGKLVSTGRRVGGIAGNPGMNTNITGQNVFIGEVTGTTDVGGLVGRASGNASVSFSYARAIVTGTNVASNEGVGVLVGNASTRAASFEEMYGQGEALVTGGTNNRGLIGFAPSTSGGGGNHTITDVWYDDNSSDPNKDNLSLIGNSGAPNPSWVTVTGGGALTTSQMLGAAAETNMTGGSGSNRWDFGTTGNWRTVTVPNNDYPVFEWQAGNLIQISGTVTEGSTPISGLTVTAQVGDNTFADVTTTTDGNGGYSFDAYTIPTQRVFARATDANGLPIGAVVEGPFTETTTVNLNLQPRAIEISEEANNGWVRDGNDILAVADDAKLNTTTLRDQLLNRDVNIVAAEDIIVKGNNGVTLTTERTLTLKSGQNIVFDDESVLAGFSNPLNVVIWSDLADDGGRVELNDANIFTNNGHVWIGGGAEPASPLLWNDLEVGEGPATSGASNPFGVSLNATSINAGTADIYISGKSTATSANGIGVRFYADENNERDQVSLIGNNITINAEGSTSASGNENYGLVVDVRDEKTSTFTAENDLNIEANPGSATSYGTFVNETNLRLQSAGEFTLATDIKTQNADVTIDNDNLVFAEQRSFDIDGSFAYRPYASSFTHTVNYPIANLDFVSPLKGLTIGKSGNESEVNINAPINMENLVAFYGEDVNLNENIQSGELILGGKAVLKAGRYMASTGDFTQDGDITFKSDENGDAYLGTIGGSYNLTSGVTTTEKYYQQRRAFRMVTSSVGGQPIFDLWQNAGTHIPNVGTHITGEESTSTGFNSSTGIDFTLSGEPSMFFFDDGWEAVVDTKNTDLEVGVPYRLMVRGDRSIDLTNNSAVNQTTLIGSGDLKVGEESFTFPSRTGGSSTFAFVANPYQSRIDVSELLDNNSNTVATKLWVWDPMINTRGGFVTIDELTGDGTATPTSSATKFIEPGQAFFIQVTESNPSIQFTESIKDVTTSLSKPATFSDNQMSLLFELQNHNNQVIDAIRLRFAGDGDNGVDNLDAGKMGNLDENLASVNENSLFTIQRRSFPENDEVIPLFTNNWRNENYSFKVNLANFEGTTVYLVDNYLGTETLLENGEVYHFSVDAGITESTNPLRFELKFDTISLGVEELDNHLFSLYPNPAKEVVNIQTSLALGSQVSVEIYNMLGQRVYNQKQTLKASNLQVNVNNFTSGVYIVNLTDEAGNKQSTQLIKE